MLVSHPADTWDTLVRELEDNPTLAKDSDRKFFLKNILIVAIAALLDELFNYQNPQPVIGLLKAAITVAAFYGTFFLCTATMRTILNKLGENNPSDLATRRFVTYSLSLNMCIHAVLSVFHQLFFLYIAILYTFYIIWEGVTPLLNVSDNNRTYASIILCAVITLTPFIILSLLFRLFPVAV